jgi:hypothetical protein
MSYFTHFLRERRHAMLEFPFWYGARFGKETGIKRGQRKVPLIVSLTTIPERLEKMSITTESLLRQTLKPDRLILWLDDDLKNRKLPLPLRRQTERGLEIRFIEDIGPYKKAIYALKEFSDCLIVVCDDDVIYPSGWLKDLAEAHELKPDCIICHRARQMSLDSKGALRPYNEWKIAAEGCVTPSLALCPVGVGGILYPPGALPPEVFNQAVFRKICPIADDIWMKAMSLLNNVRCHKVAPVFVQFIPVRGTQHKTLAGENMTRGRNDVQIRAVFDRYNLHSVLVNTDFTLLKTPPVV